MAKRITGRDKEMILFATRNKIVNRDQLQKKFFNGVKSYYPLNRRLQILVKMGLVKKTIFQNGRSTLSCFSHTELGYSLVKDLFQPCSEKTPERSEKHAHDLALVDVRRVLESKKSVKQFYGENEYQFSDLLIDNSDLLALRELNCDGFIQAEINGVHINFALELENVRQNSKIYSAKVDRIYSSKIAATLVVCTSQETLKAVQSAEASYLETHPVSPQMFYILLQDLLLSQEELIFLNLKNKKIIIR
ncbi:MAG: hypothetical protein K2Q26_08935 [Bdellovibrionales bacterium]|nr:hypothetical protein [Bdellovibrionales bacterium]